MEDTNRLIEVRLSLEEADALVRLALGFDDNEIIMQALNQIQISIDKYLAEENNG